MTIREDGFRPFYRYIIPFELNDRLRLLAKDCPDVEKATHVLMYGFINPEGRFMLEMMGVGKATPESFSLKKPYEGERVTLSCTDLMDIPVLSIIAMGSRYMNQYRKKVIALKEDEATKEQERVRQDYLLDPFRDPVYPDHIRLVLKRSGLKDEEVSAVTLSGSVFEYKVRLLETPKQDFGVEKGAVVRAKLRKDKKRDAMICASDQNPGAEKKVQHYRKEDLEDGTILKFAIERYSQSQTLADLSSMTCLLRSSYVYITLPYVSKKEADIFYELLPGEAEGEFLEKLESIRNHTFDYGVEYMSWLYSGEDDPFFPVYTDPGEIETEDAQDYYVLHIPFLAVLSLVRNTGSSEVPDIVINPHGAGFVQESRWFAFVESVMLSTEEDPMLEISDQTGPMLRSSIVSRPR